ncbi:MAG: hypothetical protein O3A96_08010 [Proteobacteria bacterium]|nr:hypothetical protein [Pseudomonadota bacterium]
MTQNDRPHARRAHGRRIAISAALFLLGAIALLWGWNAIAVDLFMLPEARFKHAIALEAALAAIVALTIGVARIVPRNQS